LSETYRKFYERMEYNIYLLPENTRPLGWKLLSKVKHPDEFENGKKHKQN